jgi:hypothetical protein
MGTWNATCGITQMPIHEGEEAVMIPLAILTQNHFQRDTLLGVGASSNKLIAKSFSYPVFGRYRGNGDVEAVENDLGKKWLQDISLMLHAKLGVLVTNKSGAQTSVPKTVSNERLYEYFARGELLMSEPNTRKEWLKHLHKTINSVPPEERGGFSHYEAQLAINLDSLPDAEITGLGMMLVARELYDALVEAEGNREISGYWEGGDFVADPGTYRDELTRYAQVQKKSGTSDSQGDEDYVQELMFETFYAGNNAPATLLLQEARKGSEIAREFWVSFMLFSSAMSGLRKQWVPQAGAGNSNGLDEVADLYAIVHKHMGKKLLANQLEDEDEV